MTVDADLFQQINNAVLDLQRAGYQGFERPLKRLGQLLANQQLTATNEILKQDVDLEVFLAESEATRGGTVGNAALAWPDDKEKELGLGLLLVERFASNPDFIIGVGHLLLYR